MSYIPFIDREADMTRKTSITGCLQGAECGHCGRPLKYGIQTDALGTVGADCLNAMVVFDRKRWGGGKPGAAYIREIAMVAEHGNRRQWPAAAFVVEVGA